MDDDDGSTTSTPQGDEVEMIPAASARENGEGYGGEIEGTPPGEEGRRGRRRRRDDDGDTMVTKAVKRGDIEGVTDALKQSGRVNAKNDQGQTPLAIACRMGQASIVTMLLWKFGADANITSYTDNKWTPLHHAIWNVHKEVVQLLLSAEAIEVNKANKHGMTPLHLACGCGDIDMLKIVVQAPGVDVNLRNWYGETPLLTACACGNVGNRLDRADLVVDLHHRDQAGVGGHVLLGVALALFRHVEDMRVAERLCGLVHRSVLDGDPLIIGLVEAADSL